MDLDSASSLALNLFAVRNLSCLEILRTLVRHDLSIRHHSTLDVPDVHIFSVAVQVVLKRKAELRTFPLHPIAGQIPAPDTFRLLRKTPVRCDGVTVCTGSRRKSISTKQVVTLPAGSRKCQRSNVGALPRQAFAAGHALVQSAR